MLRRKKQVKMITYYIVYVCLLQKGQEEKEGAEIV